MGKTLLRYVMVSEYAKACHVIELGDGQAMCGQWPRDDLGRWWSIDIRPYNRVCKYCVRALERYGERPVRRRATT